MRLVSGQKNVVLFSTGTPYTLIYGNPAASAPASAVNVPGPKSVGAQSSWRSEEEKTNALHRLDTQDVSLQPLYEKMMKGFAAADCTLFSLDTKDAAQAASLFMFDEAQFQTRSGGFFASGGVLRSVTTPFQDDKTTGATPLRRFSKLTGGQYFPNINVHEDH